MSLPSPAHAPVLFLQLLCLHKKGNRKSLFKFNFIALFRPLSRLVPCCELYIMFQVLDSVFKVYNWVSLGAFYWSHSLIGLWLPLSPLSISFTWYTKCPKKWVEGTVLTLDKCFAVSEGLWKASLKQSEDSGRRKGWVRRASDQTQSNSRLRGKLITKQNIGTRTNERRKKRQIVRQTDRTLSLSLSPATCCLWPVARQRCAWQQPGMSWCGAPVAARNCR